MPCAVAIGVITPPTAPGSTHSSPSNSVSSSFLWMPTGVLQSRVPSDGSKAATSPCLPVLITTGRGPSGPSIVAIAVTMLSRSKRSCGICW